MKFFALSFFISFICLAQLDSIKQKEHLNLLELHYEQGFYNNCLIEGKKFLQQNPNSLHQLKAKLLLAKTHFAILSFKESKELTDDVVNSVKNIDSQYQHVKLELLAQHYYELNDCPNALIYLNQITLKELPNSTLLLKSKVHLKRGETRIASTYISQLATRLDNEKSPELNNQVQCLQNWLLIENGYYNDAEKNILLNQKQWKNSNSNELIWSFELGADLYNRWGKFSLSLQQLQLAYTNLPGSEYHHLKIRWLTQIATFSKLLGNQTDYDSYLRRLQLHADRSIYKFNYFQLGNLFAREYSLYSSKQYDEFLTGIKKIRSKYPTLPEYHEFNILIRTIERICYQEQLKSEISTHDTLSKTFEQSYGKNTPNGVVAIRTMLQYNMLHGANLVFSNSQILRLDSICQSNVDSISIFRYELNSYLSKLAYHKGEFSKAFHYAQLNVKIMEKLMGRNSPEFQEALLEQALYSYWNGQFSVGLNLIKSSANYYISNSVFSKNEKMARYYSKLEEICTLYGIDSLKKKINVYFLRKSTNTLYRSQEVEAISLVSSGIYLKEKINLFAARKLLIKANQVYTNNKNFSSASLSAQYNIATIAMMEGDYKESEKWINSILQISDSIHGKESLPFAIGLFLKAYHFFSIGDPIRGKEIVQQSIRLQKKWLPDNHLFISNSLLLLARLEIASGTKSIELIDQTFTDAGNSISNSIGKNNVLYTRFLIEYSNFLISISKFEIAQSSLEQAAQFLQANPNPLLLAELHIEFGDLQYAKAAYLNANSEYKISEKIYVELFSKKHPSYCNAVSLSAKSLYMANNKGEAFSRMQEIIPTYLEFIDAHFASMSFEEKNKYWSSMKDQFEFYNFLCLSDQTQHQQYAGSVYNNILATKALLLASDIKLRNQIASSGDTILIRLFSDWIIQKQFITSLMSTSKEELAEQKIDINSLTLDLEKLEKEIMSRSNEFQSSVKKKKISWQDIKSNLSTSEDAVEIIRYRYFNKTFTDSIMYGGLIVNKTSDAPQIVIFPNGKKMESKYYKFYKNSLQFNEPDTLSYSTFWNPIKSSIPEKHTIFISCDGIYNQLNVETFSNPKSGKVVLEENTIVKISTTRDLIPTLTVRKTTTNPILLCGNPTFYLNSTAENKISSLPGAEKEVKQIKTILDGYGKNSTLLLNETVTEDTLLHVKSPQVLHIATHGYFAETKKPNGDFTYNPLLYSGILLKGAGDILAKGSYHYVNSESGILTAYEAINMSLDNTEMVVLSACETGKGDIQVGEGVMGLQRSFLVAGAKCIIVAMVKVNDEVTNELMSNFYKNWQEGMSKRDAFNKAKWLIKEKYKEPKYWGAFVMIEGKVEKFETQKR